MGIPLDYYRILGIPIAATDEQLSMAYQDRLRQLPRREYSELAIAARKQLLEQAYAVLSDPEKRTEYEQQFLENLENSSPQIDGEGNGQRSGIETENRQLAGVLLLLQELGEYDLVVQLGQEYLQGEAAGLNPTERGDIILSIALAQLELSREQWHQKDYEKAALIASQGLDLLTEAELFPLVHSEISSDFYKLRPYRILELLGQDLTQDQERAKGLELLREMLEERQGIEGKGSDRSGLSIDNFLLFMQQLRTYLTVEEQLALFRAEAKRPSPAATYLKVYALIAKGFAHKQPYYIQEAQESLERLSKRQDVSLEQSACALLLGQTALAQQFLEKSDETEAIEYIRKQTGNSDEPLLGLCRYGEHWLQTEVFCHFRDLINAQVSLEDYFADPQVQAYLEPLSIAPVAAEDFSEAALVSLPSSPSQAASLVSAGGVFTMRESYSSSFSSWPSSESHYPQRIRTGTVEARTQLDNPPKNHRRRRNHATAAPEEYTTQGNVVLNPSYPQNPPRQQPRRRRVSNKPSHPESLTPSLPTPPRKTSRKRKKFPGRFRVTMGIVTLGAIALSALAIKAFLDSRSPLAALSGEQLELFLDRPPLEMSAADASDLSGNGSPLTPVKAKEILEVWLSVKAQALGPNHQVGQLKTILGEPMLSLWTKRAQTLEGKNYWQYQHQVEVQSVTVDAQNPNSATVEAKVKEKASYYEQGKLNPQRSFDDHLRIRYDLVRTPDGWLLKNSQVVE